MGLDEVLCRYVPNYERQSILVEVHGGVIGGHYARIVIVQKILRVGLQWPTMCKYSKEYCMNFYQRTRKLSQRDELPLNPQVSLQEFDKWAINFLGPIQPPSKKTGTQYIITATEYLTRWAEAQPMKDCSVTTVAKFIFEYILSRFGYPKIFMTERGSYFLNETIDALIEEFHMYHQKSTSYHP